MAKEDRNSIKEAIERHGFHSADDVQRRLAQIMEWMPAVGEKLTSWWESEDDERVRAAIDLIRQFGTALDHLSIYEIRWQRS